MALADYFRRNATAVSQIMLGFEETAFAERLENTPVAVSFAAEAQRPEGRALLDLVVRLLARLYPTLSLHPGSGADGLAGDLQALARSINPAITLTDAEARIGIAIGQDAPANAPLTIYAGSDGWNATVSTTGPCTVGNSLNPFGAGAAACFACANVFRAAILDDSETFLDRNLRFSALELTERPSSAEAPFERLILDDDAVLVGLGAIGNTAAWALSRAPIEGRIHLVDHEPVELSNLQRYVLAARTDVGQNKVLAAGRAFGGALCAVEHHLPWAEFVAAHGYQWTRVLVALDSARDRRAVQASLPYWIANAWTQPGDLGLSTHSFGSEGACLSCLYLPPGSLPNEDELIANALGIPENLMQVRELLYRGNGVPRDLLLAVAEKLGLPIDALAPYEGQPLRSLYVEGICGGAILPLGRLGTPRQELHVPLAHQSALAGVLLGAALVAQGLGWTPVGTRVTRINLLRPLGEHLTQPALKDGRGICICEDADYLATYRRKYVTTLPSLDDPT